MTTTLPRAGFGRKLGAVLLDSFFIIIITGATPLVTLSPGIMALYNVGMWTWKGTTLGGMICRVKGVRLDGEPMDFKVALVRWLCSCLSAFPLLLGYFWSLWDKDNQTWHDKLAGTLVVEVAPGEALI